MEDLTIQYNPQWVPLNEFEQRIRTGQIKNAISLAVWSVFPATIPSLLEQFVPG